MYSPIVLIHGLWLTPRGWEGWKARFEQRGLSSRTIQLASF